MTETKKKEAPNASETKAPNPKPPLIQVSKKDMIARAASGKLVHDPVFMEAMRNLPKSEIIAIQQFFAQNGPFGTMSDLAASVQVITLRWSNAICLSCLQNKSDTYFRCGKCHLVYWCSAKCRQADKLHAITYCCNKDAPALGGLHGYAVCRLGSRN